MLVGGKLAHVGAALQDHGLRQRDTHSIHQADVHSADAFQVGADFLTLVKLILAVRIALAGGERLEFTAIPIRAGLGIQALDLLVALQDLLGVEVIQRHRLLQHKQVLFQPGAGQSLADFFFTLLAAWLPQ